MDAVVRRDDRGRSHPRPNCIPRQRTDSTANGCPLGRTFLPEEPGTTRRLAATRGTRCQCGGGRLPKAIATIRQRNPAKPMGAVVYGIAEVGIPPSAAICQQRQGKIKRRFEHFADANLCETWQVSLCRLVSRGTPPRSGLPGCDGQDRLWEKTWRRLHSPSDVRQAAFRSAPQRPFGVMALSRDRTRPV